jgi:putative component of membrane protein insertase Oxa1/YidC/SpoIIIJ protein YidD
MKRICRCNDFKKFGYNKKNKIWAKTIQSLDITAGAFG